MIYFEADCAQSCQETLGQGGAQPALAQSGREDGGAEPGDQGGDHHDEEVSGQEEMETDQGYHQMGKQTSGTFLAMKTMLFWFLFINISQNKNTKYFVEHKKEPAPSFTTNLRVFS